MNRMADILISDMRHLIGDFGKSGGLVSPSLYDTAQVLRLAPPAEGVWDALDWLIEQQQIDGGWGDPSVPLARDLPTLAAVLALDTYATRTRDRVAMRAALTFLRRQVAFWNGPLPEDIPIGAELLLPALLAQARKQGIELPHEPYAQLAALGTRRRRLIAEMKPRAATTPAHSWESWGSEPDTAMIDPSGGVGHSPAASAAWLHSAAGRPDLAPQADRVRAFLEQAAAATGTGIPGVVPTVWPYPRNEQVVSMYTLLIAQLLDQPALHDAIHPQVADMWHGVRAEGQGISDWFTPDGDITAMTLAVVASKGYQADRAMLQRYRNGNSYLTYRHELQRSFSATAHAAHTLALLGGDPDPLFDQLCEHRAPDGRWMGDKWHASWLYLTAHTIIALLAAGRSHKALETLPALLDHQHRDGSWGVTTAVEEETSYGVLALIAFDRAGLLPEHGQQALHRAGAWLAQHYRPLTEATGSCWIGKELYRPRRISRTVEVSATLSCVLTGYAA